MSGFLYSSLFPSEILIRRAIQQYSLALPEITLNIQHIGLTQLEEDP